MNRGRLRLGILLGGGVGVLVLAGFLLFFPRQHHSFGAYRPPSLFSNPKAYLKYRLERPRAWKVQVSGTAGTPVAIGYEVDLSHAGVLYAVIPTNFTIYGRHIFYFAVKNQGKENVRIAVASGPARYPVLPLFNRFSIPPIYPPGYGPLIQRVERDDGGSGSSGTLNPPDWPEMLPPGISRQQARKHDFARELLEARVLAYEAIVARAPQDQEALLGLAEHYASLNNRPASNAAYERFLAVSCSDQAVLNSAVYSYIENGGTNLDLAYEQGLKALSLYKLSGETMDTVGWVLFKKGDYEQALEYFKKSIGHTHGDDATVGLHLGLTYYKLRQEDRAREALKEVVLKSKGSWQAAEASRYLGMLEVPGGKDVGKDK